VEACNGGATICDRTTGCNDGSPVAVRKAIEIFWPSQMLKIGNRMMNEDRKRVFHKVIALRFCGHHAAT
jgi:hypothetical protein